MKPLQKNRMFQKMKIKLTLLFTQYDRSISMLNPKHIRVFLDDDFECPFRYLTTQEPLDTLSQICYDNFTFDSSWLNASVSDFRKISSTEYEVIYSSSRPLIPNSSKCGNFYTMQELSSLEKKIDSYYEQILRSKNFIINE